MSGELNVKDGTPLNEELEEVAVEIGDSWKSLGRCLKFSNAQITAFHGENEKYSEKAFGMLLNWKRRYGPDASYQELNDSLCHPLVGRNDLARTFCCEAAGIHVWPRRDKAQQAYDRALKDVKDGTPSDDELEEVAEEIGDSWQSLGRRLGFTKAELTAFHRENEKYSEKASKMLLTWKKRNGPDALYKELFGALSHRLVGQKDLAVKVCCDAAGIHVWPRRDKAQQPYDTALEDASDPLSKPKALLLEESLLKRDRKTNILRGKVKDEEDLWELTEAAGFIRFPPKAVTELMEITYSLWSPGACSPPLGENEALVSNVIELSCDGLSGLKLSGDFNEGVTLALSHSATDLEGYEVVIQQLMDSGNNEWKDLKTKNTWRASGIQGDPPLAEAKVTQCSSFAVIWRLKSFIFSSSPTSMTDPVFTCIVSEYPDVSVAIPRSDLPASGDFSLTIKVQEVPCDEGKDDGVLVGPILHISSSPDVRSFKEPVTIKIPFTLREAKKEVLNLSSDGQLRILFFNCGAKCPDWTEITDELKTPADLKDGVVTFKVKRFSKYMLFRCSKRKGEPSSSDLEHLAKKPKMPQEAGFLACIHETIPSRTLMLTLFCYPLQKKHSVNRTVSSIHNVLSQVQKNGFERMCVGDKAFVSVMEQIKPLTDKHLENFFLKFLDDQPFDRDMPVTVEGEGKGVPKVELVIRQEDRQEDKLMCELFFSELQTPACAPAPSDKKLKVPLLESCNSGLPPQLSFTLPRLSDLKPLSKKWDEVKLPIDVLLLTVNDCEFVSCYDSLEDPLSSSYYYSLGCVYFGTMGKGQIKVALLKCGSARPGGILTDVKKAAEVLRPKFVGCVGTCGSLTHEKAKLGDVVLAAKLTLYARKEFRNDRVVPCGVTTLCSRDTAHLINHAAIGWKAPLKNPKAREITVHSDSEVLSGPELVNSGWRKEELIEQHPAATAIEMEGEGVFSAAHDLKMEWLVVKGISNYADGTTTEAAPWKEFASVMAASIVCHMLKNPIVLRDWPHYKGLAAAALAGPSRVLAAGNEKGMHSKAEQQQENPLKTLEKVILEADELKKGSAECNPREALENNACIKGYRILDNEGGGNCMFHALSHQLLLVIREKVPHQELRKQLVDYLRENPNQADGTHLFSYVHDGSPTWDAYLDKMEMDGAWGDHIVLQAAADCYKLPIRVITSHPDNKELMLQPQTPSTTEEVGCLVLGYITDCHYVSLVAAKDGSDGSSEQNSLKRGRSSQHSADNLSLQVPWKGKKRRKKNGSDGSSEQNSLKRGRSSQHLADN